MHIKKILVPVDFSKYSDRALNYALFLAEHYQADITLFHIVLLFHEDIDEMAHLKDYEKFIKSKEQDSGKLLQQHCTDGEKRGINITSEMRRGISAADSIIEFLEGNEFDLVVMGTHGRSGFKKWVYGSVAEKVVRLSPVPVLTTHHPSEKPVIGKILAPVDFSDYSRSGLKAAGSIAKTFNAEVHYLYSVEKEVHPAYYAASVESIFTVDRELKDRVQKRFKEFVGKEGEEKHLVITEGKAHKQITQYANENKIDLIVMATRGVTGLEHFLVGSTTERVVCLAPCPVLTVGRKEM